LVGYTECEHTHYLTNPCKFWTTSHPNLDRNAPVQQDVWTCPNDKYTDPAPHLNGLCQACSYLDWLAQIALEWEKTWTKYMSDWQASGLPTSDPDKWELMQTEDKTAQRAFKARVKTARKALKDMDYPGSQAAFETLQAWVTETLRPKRMWADSQSGTAQQAAGSQPQG